MRLRNADPRPTTRRLLQLDFLRGIAILLVIGHHEVIGRHLGWANLVAGYWGKVGWTGVDLFFVLSGFLVGGLLFSEVNRGGTIDVRRFLIRRGFKIWPSYYLYVTCLFFQFWLIDHQGWSAALRAVGPNLINLQNYLWRGEPPVGLPHTWSLAVEEHFYILLPLFLGTMCSGGRIDRLKRWFPVMGVLVIAGCLGLRLLTSTGPAGGGLMVWAERHEYPSHLRLDSLFVGVWLAYAFHLRPRLLSSLAKPKVAVTALVCGIALVVAATLPSQLNRFSYTVGFTVIAVGYACVVASLVMLPIDAPPVRWIWSLRLVRGIAFVGTYSYSVYLWHIVLGQIIPRWIVREHWLEQDLTGRWLLVMSTYIAGSVIAGMALAELVEFPAIVVRDRFFPSRVASVSTHLYTVVPAQFIVGECQEPRKN